jgi:hypothetical protein
MRKLVSVFAFFFFCAPCFGQQGPLLLRSDSVPVQLFHPDTLPEPLPSEAAVGNTRMTPKEFVRLQMGSLKEAFTKPFHMSGRNWGDVGKFALVMGALSFADRPVQRFALDMRNSNEGIINISNQVTRLGGPMLCMHWALWVVMAFCLKKKNCKPPHSYRCRLLSPAEF